MTVPSTTRRAGPYLGNGVTTSFPFTFKVFAKTDIALTTTNAAGLSTALVLDSDYSVTLNVDQDSNPGGSITYPISGSPMAAGYTLVGVGSIPYDQTTSFPDGGAYRASTTEDTFDRTEFQIQQLAEEVGRALTLPPSAASADTTLPAPVANNIIGWDEAAQALVNYTPASLATVVVAGTSYFNVFNGDGTTKVFALTADPGSVNALDIAVNGVPQKNGIDFNVSGTTLTFVDAPSTGTQNIAVRYVAAVPVGSANAQDVTFLQAGTGAVPRSVQSKEMEVVSVKDFGAKGDGVTDDTAAFVNAINYIQSQGAFNIGTGHWPAAKRFKLTGPPGTYMFSGQIATPVGLSPNFVNFDLSFPGAVFKALPSYSAIGSFIHMKAAFDYAIEGIAFDGFPTYAVIFNDSSLTQNYGGKTTYRDLRFANCQYGIRHEMESTVAVVEQCVTDPSMKQFLNVWRCDQMVVRDCFFNWSQLSKVDFDSFIVFGRDDYPSPEPAYPGTGNYNIGRLNMSGCMCIPVDNPGTAVRTAWVKVVSGSVRIEGCHFGPESSNRPITVLSKIQGATYQSITDLADAGVTIVDSSCVNSFGVVYCLDDYPNYIHLRNIRLNTLEYSNVGAERYLVTGNAATLNAKTTKYSSPSTRYFKFDIGAVTPQEKNLLDIDPALIFPRQVTSHAEICIADSNNTTTTNNATAHFDLVDRDTLSPNFPIDGSSYEVTITAKLFSTPAGNVTYQTTLKGIVEIAQSGTSLNIGYTSLYSANLAGIGSVPSVSATFRNGTTGTSFTTQTIANLTGGDAYWLRITLVSNNAGNLWQGAILRIRRLV